MKKNNVFESDKVEMDLNEGLEPDFTKTFETDEEFLDYYHSFGCVTYKEMMSEIFGNSGIKFRKF